MEISRFIRRALLISFVYVILSQASCAVNPEKLSEDQFVQAYFNMYGDYLSGTRNVSKDELNDVIDYYMTTDDIAKNLHDVGPSSGEMVGSILADTGVDFDCSTCDASVLNQRCCIYRIGEKPMMYECVGTEVKGVNEYLWKNIYECTFGCCSNRCCRDSNPTTSTFQPTTTKPPATTTTTTATSTTRTTTTTKPTSTTTSTTSSTNPTATSSTTSTTSGTTTTTGLDNCQSDTDCVSKYGGCYVCPYKGADCSKGSANCQTDEDCSDYGSGWKCVSQCCMPPGTTTTTSATTTTVAPTTTTVTTAPSTTTSTTTASSSTATSSTTTTTIAEKPCDAYKRTGALPTEFDWRNVNGGDYTTPVKDQADCASCCDFAGVAAMEGMYKVEKWDPSSNPDLSEQTLVSCCDNMDCSHCGYDAYDCLETGIVDEACFPYTSTKCGFPRGMSGTSCTPECSCSSNYKCAKPCDCSGKCSDWQSRVWSISGYQYISDDDKAVKEKLICNGPLPAGVDATDWLAYGPDCGGGNSVDHVVTLAGYSDSGGYWILKNSWGSSWNGDGYFKVDYGKCGMDDFIYFTGLKHP